MKVYEVGGVKIGEGKPKIIVPIVGRVQEAIIEKGQEISSLPIDIVEWRVDFYEHALEPDKVLETLGLLKKALKEIPILFTFRTGNEGGEKSISPEQYTELNRLVAESGLAALIDVEIFQEEAVVKKNIDLIHRANGLVVGSNHDFQKTPDQDELVSRLRKMQELGADIPKLAVMPQTVKDVLVLLGATHEMVTFYADRPIITMSMAAKGVISRMTGEVFGSAATFGMVGQASAPGQIPVEKLGDVLDIIHQAL